MNENAQMMTEQYQNKLEEIYSPDFQHDLLETCIETFGEDFREQFENINEVCYPIFINMDSRKEDANLRGTIAHEVLHALEFITQRDEENEDIMNFTKKEK